ncbi:hypothetical protein [Rhizobium leguminosarum]|uniref:hypothetical protein n=1 Tax=Rhizobium leguminosarum TaxID=384 RepID=UPI001AE54951|nr:hypothetical protein [Rhizobium leguminosarum]MBP2445936.1 hypothetical protein [Rhizobium leguminosarum]
MQILSIRPDTRGGNAVARFDAELAPGIRAYDLKLVQARNGLRVFGPSIAGGPAITFAPAVADELATLAMGEVARDDKRA